MRKILALALFSPIIAIADPIFLDCEVSSESEKQSFSVSLDADNGKVTHTHESGSAFNADGFFAANTITYQSFDFTRHIKITFKYEINRTDLSLNQSVTIEPIKKKFHKANPPKTTLSTGICKISEVSELKI